MVYTIFLGKEGKRVYAIGPERRVYTTRPQTRKKEKKEGCHGGGVYFFLPWTRISRQRTLLNLVAFQTQTQNRSVLATQFLGGPNWGLFLYQRVPH